MLVEEHERGQIVKCLICKQPIKVPAGSAAGTNVSSKPS
jgi:hypothetical protein